MAEKAVLRRDRGRRLPWRWDESLTASLSVPQRRERSSAMAPVRTPRLRHRVTHLLMIVSEEHEGPREWLVAVAEEQRIEEAS
jgi:hypothetical protein